MIRRWLWVLVLLGVPMWADAQTSVPVHNNMAVCGTGTGGVEILAAARRSLLVVTNGSDTAILVTVDDTDASATNGLYLASAGGQVAFDTHVPRGSLRCYSGSNGKTLQFMEGR